MRTREVEVEELRSRLERLETVVSHLVDDDAGASRPVLDDVRDEQSALAWLKDQGIVRDPTPQERQLAAEWDALPEAEKQNHIEYMQHLVLDPPLSQMIADSRR